MFLKLESWNKEEAAIFEGVLEVEDLEESLDLQSLKVFLKLESWNKACIFKGASIFEGLQFSPRPSGVKNFQPLQMERNLLFIEFRGLLWTWELELSCLSLLLDAFSKDPSSWEERSDTFALCRGDIAVSDPTSIGGDRAFAVRSNALERSDTFIVWRGGTAVSNPTSIEGRLGFCCQIHRPGRSDRAPSSFGEVVLPSAIQLLSGDDRAFIVRSTVLVGAIGHLHQKIQPPSRSDQAPSFFGEVVLPSAIQLLSGDDWTFAVRSTVLVGAIRHLRRLERSDRTPSSFREVVLPSAIQLLSRDDRAFFHQIHCPGRSDRAPSLFGEVILPSAIQLLSEDDRAFAVRSTVLIGAIRHLHHFERWRQNFTIDVFLEKPM
ncbi:hypothetical protein E5676_scaffold169G00970 [Cucumis melo var. makuwa]|uniref:Uncharacterized protein n=1 Tax=Cucumis melo var. makuwa TaxID=1194695 RepID=A0A5D3BN04_CUCMM|nr:hypothetical protein E5676_scaffold169G00970 [Cucumis melo var. makuwa]